MENASKFLHCGCFVKKKHMHDYDLQRFLAKKLPVFWVMGPPSCGKSTLAEMLAKSSKYHLLKIEDLIYEEIAKGRQRGKIISEFLNKNHRIPNEIILNLIKEVLIHTHEQTVGYIIDGFPVNLQQAKLFEKKICLVSMVIYVTLVLDAVLARKITQIGAFDANEERIVQIRHSKCLNEVAKKYDQKTIKLHSNYPPEDTCTRLVEDLEDFWGYKFLRLYNKNQ